MRHLPQAFPRSRQEGESLSVDWYTYRLFFVSSKSVSIRGKKTLRPGVLLFYFHG